MERIEHYSNTEQIIAPHTTDPDERLVLAKILTKIMSNARDAIRGAPHTMVIDEMERAVYYLSRVSAYGYINEDNIRHELWPLVVIKMKLLKRTRTNLVRRHAVKSLFVKAINNGHKKPLPLVFKGILD